MKIEKVLEDLEELFSQWGISTRDWVFTAQYAFKLLGYDVEVRKGHLNIQVEKGKLDEEILKWSRRKMETDAGGKQGFEESKERARKECNFLRDNAAEILQLIRQEAPTKLTRFLQ